MADGSHAPRGPRRSPPRHDRPGGERRWSPPRGPRRDDYGRRDNWNRFDGHGGGGHYHDHRDRQPEDEKNKAHFQQHRTEPGFVERYHPASIIERRKRDALVSQQLAAEFYAKLESDTLALPDYDADAHADSFPVEEKPIEVESKTEIEVEKESGGIEEDNAMKEDQPAESKPDETPKKTAPVQQLVPRVTNERIPKDLDLARRLAAHFDAMRSIASNVLLGKFGVLPPPVDPLADPDAPPVAPPAEVKAPEAFTQLHQKITAYSEKQQLDLLIYYLATVHFHSYYTCNTFQSQEKDKVQEIYRSSEKFFDSNLEAGPVTWSQNFEKKIHALLSLDLRIASGEKRLEPLTELFYKDKIVKDSPDRFRCAVCNKMFKGPTFVRKHIVVKHPENLDEIKEKAQEEQFYRNYLAHCEKQLELERERERDRRRERSPRRDRPAGEARRSRSPPRADAKRPRSPQRDEHRFDDRRQHGGNFPRGGRGFDSRGPRPNRQFRNYDMRGETLEPPPEYRGKMDPRAKGFVDLDRPKEDTFEIDYEKALAAFAGES